MEGGRGQTYSRDFDLVSGADLVLAFFPIGEEMAGGTGHVVEAALARDVPVQAYGVDGQGHLVRIGEVD